MKNKKALFVILTVFILSLVGIGLWVKSKSPTSNPLATKQITDIDYKTVYSDVKKYIGKTVKWNGRVFTEVEKDDSGIYFQMYEGDNSDHNTLVYIPDFKETLKEDDFVVVEARIDGLWKGKNAFNADIDAIKLVAYKVETGSKAKILAPAIKTIPINDTKDVHGFLITLDRVELAEKETRIYVRIKNTTDEEVTFFDTGSKLVQGSKQIESEYLDNDEELPTSVAPNVEAIGAIVFDKLAESPTEVTLFLDRPYVKGNYSDSSDLEFKFNLQ